MKASPAMRLASLALMLLGLGKTTAATATGDKTITKVVKLLQGMLEKSKEEGDEERKIFAKFKCYCDSSNADKTKAIEDNTQLISLLESKIEELQGSNGEESSKCADLKASMADNEQQRDEATTIRDKQNANFVSEKADLEAAIDQMKNAIATLTEVGADQTASTGADNKQFMAKSASLLSLKASVQSALSAAEAFMSPNQYKSVTSFLQAPFTGTYTSQSGQVMGIIKNMRDTFKANLATAEADEISQKKSYDALIKLKEEAHEEMSGLYEEAQSDLGSNDNELSNKRSQLKQAEDEKASDEEFLEKLLPMCKERTESYGKRKVMRANEEVAVAQAISILNSDAAFDTFSTVDAATTGGTGTSLNFLQEVNSHFPGVSDSDVRAVMQRLLHRASGPRVARVISTLQANNPFDTVLDEIDKMLEVITEEGKADLKKRDWCKKERDTNKESHGEKEGEIRSLNTKIDRLDNTIEDAVEGLKVQIENTERSLQENDQSQKTETTERQEENKAYQADVKNLVAAEDLLQNAIKVLKAYYDKFAASAAFLQKKSREDPAAPETWNEYEGQSGDGNKAVNMLEFILKETQSEQSAAHTEEETSQAEYEDSMTSLKEEQGTKEKSLSDLQNDLAKAEEDRLSAQENHKATTKDKEAIESYLEDIKPGCDFITDNFQLREDARAKESSALNTAMDTLKASPAYKNAVAEAHVEDFGDCKAPCVKDENHVKCKACQASVTVSGYCAGHKDDNVPGC